MKKKALIISIILISFSFLGILVLQYTWIENIAQFKEDTFDQSVHQALSITSTKMEKQESAALLIQSEAMIPPTEKSEDWQFAQDSIFNLIGNQFIQNNNSFNKLSKFPIASKPKRKKHTTSNQPIIRESFIYSKNGEKTIINNWKSTPTQLLQDESNIKLKRFNNVARELVIELNQRSYPNEYNIDFKNIKTIIKDALSENGINLAFEYAIISDSLNRVIYSSSKNAVGNSIKHYESRLYPNSLFDNKLKINIYFPTRNNYIYESIAIQLCASLLLTIITAFTFWYILNTIRKQKKLSDIKSDFINNMTHEFKTPIATISLATDSISNPKIITNPESIKQFTKIIKEENKRMNNHVERVLQMSQMERENFKIKTDIFDCSQSIESIISSFALRIKEMNGSINYISEAKNHSIKADKHHFENVISNFIDNAIKYNSENPVITIKTLNDSNSLIIKVSDNGIGIKKDDLKYIFEKFYRVPTGNIHNVKGFGLGLNYSKEIIEKFEGKISVNSEFGHGSTFTIQLPIIKDK